MYIMTLINLQTIKLLRFIITGNSLQIYFYPYEIGPYAAGFITFEIPYSEITDIIDTGGELWKAFDKNTNNKTTNQDNSQIESTINNYEIKMVDAINNNNFSLVEPYLLKGSNLYKSQALLVESLNKQEIKEKLVDFSAQSVKWDADSKRCKANVIEKIDIKYQNKDYQPKQFFYTYTLVYSAENNYYLLSDIEKWDGN